MTAIEYTIYEQPQPPALDCPVLENPTADKPILENPTPDNPTSENPTQLNKELLKTNLPTKEKLNTDISNTHSIAFHSLNPSPSEDAAQPPERKRKEATDAYRVYEEIIKDNIEYDYLIQDRYLDRDRIEEILALILETSLHQTKNNPYRRGRPPGRACKSKIYETEQRTYPLCTGMYAGKHHQNPQHQAVHESCPFQCPVYDWQLLHVPCISRYVRRAHYPVGKKQGHTRLHLQRGRKPVNQPKGGFYDDTENRSFDF